MAGVRLARVHEGTFPTEVRGSVRDVQTLQRHAPRCALPSFFLHTLCVQFAFTRGIPGQLGVHCPPELLHLTPPELKHPPQLLHLPAARPRSCTAPGARAIPHGRCLRARSRPAAASRVRACAGARSPPGGRAMPARAPRAAPPFPSRTGAELSRGAMESGANPALGF